MNKKNAKEQDLRFTGIFSHDKEEVKDRIKKERKEKPGSRIMLVTEPPNRLSRGHHGNGYSAYADEVYFAHERLRTLRHYAERFTKTRKKIREECDAKIEQAEKQFAKDKNAFEEAMKIIINKEN